MADENRKLNIFISYSRDDLAFAEQLYAALEAFGFGLSMDQRGISAGEDWQKRLGSLIRDADTVAFVLSPSSARSEMCAWEVGEAVRLGKRIIPVLCRSLDGAKAPEKLASLNYIFFYAEPKSDGSGFGSGLALLVKALNTDLDWLREHTRYLQRATEWDTGGRSASRLLSGPDITSAKAWATRRPKDAPEPTPLQLDFIKASEAEAMRQQSAETQRLKEMAAAQDERSRALAEREEAQQREAEAQKREVEAQKARARALAERGEAQKRFIRALMVGLVVSISLAAAAIGLFFYANAQRQKAEAALAETERELLRAQTAELRAVIERLDGLKANAESEGKTDEVASDDQERAQLASRLDDVSRRYRDKIAEAMGFRGDLGFLIKWEGNLGGVKVFSAGAEIDPFTDLRPADASTIKTRYDYLLTPNEMAAVLSLVSKSGDELKTAYEQHRAVIDRIQIKTSDVAQLVPEAARPFWVELQKQFPVLNEAATPGTVHTALLSLATNVGMGPMGPILRNPLSSAIANREWLHVADLIEVTKSAHNPQIQMALKRRRSEEASLIRNELKDHGAANDASSEPSK
jgi:GH24 family phage-related lysozyme (muramidase)